MKHKRQTLGKQGDDRDDEDSINSDGGKSSKMSSDKFLDDELSKKSCQGCEMPQVGNLCGTHDDVPDIGATRGTNNNTPSATNNNTNFNNNSNGASSVGSSSSFDKLIVEEDSHSNEDLAGSHTSPRVTKKNNQSTNGASTVSIKVEGRSRNSSCDRKIGPSKISPALKDPSNLSDPIAMKMSPKNSLPGTTGVNTSPMGMAPMMYPQMRKSSPTTATAIASATVTIQNVPNNVSPFAARASPQFPQYHINQTDYRADRQKHQLGYQVNHPPVYGSGDLYNPEHPVVNDSSQTYVRDSSVNVSAPNMPTARTSRSRQAYVNYQPYYYNKNSPNVESYGNYSHGYQPEHGPYNHYSYTGPNMYPHDANTVPGHMPPNVHMNHDGTGNYYPNENVQNMQKMHGQSEYHHAKANYYENNPYNAVNQIPPNDPSYIPQESFPVAANPPAAVLNANATAPVESNEGYTNYHQYYNNEAAHAHAAPPASGTPGENSNSSSDFNFLSSLTNDYTPEYYQI